MGEVIATIDDHWNALVSEDEQAVHRDAAKAEEFLKKKDEIIMQGVHIIGLISSQLEIQDHYQLKRELKFLQDSAVGINVRGGQVKLYYDFKVEKNNPFFLHEIKIRDDNREILTGKIYTTKTYDVFKDVMKRMNNFHDIFKYNTNPKKPKIAEISLNSCKLEKYLSAIHMDKGYYNKMYGDAYSADFISFFEPANAVGALGNLNDKKYIFKKQTFESYMKNSETDKIFLYGDKTSKMAMTWVNMFLKDGLGNNLSGSETVAVAI